MSELSRITVVHASDLHLSERLLEPPHASLKLPHRFGHDVQTFLALDQFLNAHHWDILVLSGDISRIGDTDSFVWARNWLENRITIGDQEFGLNMHMRPERRYVVVPGNHDRFDGHLSQRGLGKYLKEFPRITTGSKSTVECQGVKVNFHLFDSSFEGGGFGLGRIDGSALTTRSLFDNEIDVAILHHHFVQPPHHRREPKTELVNCKEVAVFLLGSAFDAILFGHTHKSLLECIPGKLVTKAFAPSRWHSKLWRQRFPKWRIAQALDGDTPVSYRRERSRCGRYPSTASHFLYLYLRDILRQSVRGPEEFETVRGFYAHLQQFDGSEQLVAELKALQRAKVLLSMAPSACQAEADYNGFHHLVFECRDGVLETVESRVYRFDGVAFAEKGQVRRVRVVDQRSKQARVVGLRGKAS